MAPSPVPAGPANNFFFSLEPIVENVPSTSSSLRIEFEGPPSNAFF
jgi:hypothetical protein